MTIISTSNQEIIEIEATLPEVYDFFADPDQWPQVSSDIQDYKRLAADKAHWLLKEKNEAGIHFQASYIVQYSGNAQDRIQWQTTEGNLGLDGSVVLTPLGTTRTQVCWSEKVAPDLPVSPIMAKILKLVVSRETRAEHKLFLTRIKCLFES